jgi:hypothetical protein
MQMDMQLYSFNSDTSNYAYHSIYMEMVGSADASACGNLSQLIIYLPGAALRTANLFLGLQL